LAPVGEWHQSEQDFREALSTADRQPSVDPAILQLLLTSYSYVLRKNHRGGASASHRSTNGGPYACPRHNRRRLCGSASRVHPPQALADSTQLLTSMKGK
jgi:hypothetical protein